MNFGYHEAWFGKTLLILTKTEDLMAFIVKKHPQKTTPVQNVKLYATQDSSSNNEIEEQLPQMMKFFDSKGSSSVAKYKLDLSTAILKNNKNSRMTWNK